MGRWRAIRTAQLKPCDPVVHILEPAPGARRGRLAAFVIAEHGRGLLPQVGKGASRRACAALPVSKRVGTPCVPRYDRRHCASTNAAS